MPADIEDPEWFQLDARLIDTGVPFEAMSLRERRMRAEQLDEPMLRGSWLARWPGSQLPAITIALCGTDREAAEGFDRAVWLARESSSPRDSREVLRRGRTILTLITDHWNPAADAWLTQVRGVFADADATQAVPRRLGGELPGS